MAAPLEVVFQEQSYSHLQSGRSLGCDHFRGDIADPCGVTADPGIPAPQAWAIGNHAVGDADRCTTY